MDERLRGMLSAARRDRVSGASAIALACAMRLRRLFESGVRIPERDIVEFALGLAEAQPNMAPLWNLANDVLLSKRSADEIVSVCRRAEEHHAGASRAVGRRAARELKGRTVVTNSASAAVLEALVSANEKGPLTALVPESRPMREGLRMAAELARRGVRVTLLADPSLSRAVRLADVAIVGSDAVTGSHVVGKVGIVNLALSCREYGIRCLVCADTSKLFPVALREEQRPPQEVLRKIPEGVVIDNVYFEEARVALFSKIVTEVGSLSPKEVAGMVRKKRIAPELMRSISSPL